MKTIKRTIQTITLSTLSSVALIASSMSFDFKDPKGVNNAQFLLDAPLEQISGFANGVTGTINYNPEKIEELSGKIVIDAKSVAVGNPVMLDHLQSEQWLNTKKHGEITFMAQSTSNIKVEGKKIMVDVTGVFSLKGVTKEITVPVSFVYLENKLGDRMGKANLKGDLLVVRSDFTINRSDYGIMPGQKTDKVSEEIKIALRVVGSYQK